MTNESAVLKRYSARELEFDFSFPDALARLTTKSTENSAGAADALMRDVVKSVNRFIFGHASTYIELESSSTSPDGDERLEVEFRDDPAVSVKNGSWDIPDDEADRKAQTNRLRKQLTYFKATRAPGTTSEPYISECLAGQAENLLSHLIAIGVTPEVAADPDGGLSIKLSYRKHTALLFLDEDEWRLMTDPLDNERRAIKRFKFNRNEVCQSERSSP